MNNNWNQDCQENNSLRYVEDTSLMAKSKEELESLLMRVKDESEKAGLKLSISKTEIMHPVLSLFGKKKGKNCKQ